jgi:uroporphyrinogen decarboxylase
MTSMSKRERLTALLRGEATDRPAWSLWRHFFEAESSAEQLAGQTIGWARRYDFDFIKVNARAEYHVEVWGARYHSFGVAHQKPERLEYPLRSADDLARLTPRGLDAEPLGEQLEALSLIGQGLGGEVPFIETVFSPLGVLGYLVESDPTLVRYIREHPAAVHQALEAITRTFAPFAEACLSAGADGIFFATTRWASRDVLTPAEYAEFGRPYDLCVLEAARGGTFNMLHVCDGNNMLADLADYPVQSFNWASTDSTNPSITASANLPGLRVAGLGRDVLTEATADQALREVATARADSGDRNWALGPGCTIASTSRDDHIRAVGRAIGLSL